MLSCFQKSNTVVMKTTGGYGTIQGTSNPLYTTVVIQMTLCTMFVLKETGLLSAGFSGGHCSCLTLIPLSLIPVMSYVSINLCSNE